MKSGVVHTDLNSPEKLEFEVQRILAKRKKRLGNAHNPSPAELRKQNGDQGPKQKESVKKIVLVTEATQTDLSSGSEKRTSNGYVYGDYKQYSDDRSRRSYSPSPNYEDANYNRESFEDSRNFRKSNGYRNSYEEKSEPYTPPSMRRTASAHTSPWALKREMFLEDDVPEYKPTTLRSKLPIPYQSTTFTTSTTSFPGRDRYATNTPYQVTNGTSPYKLLSDQIAENISKNVLYTDPTTNYTSSPSSSSLFFPNFSPPKQPQQHTTTTPPQPLPPPPAPSQDQKWQPEQLQQQLQQHQQQQLPKKESQIQTQIQMQRQNSQIQQTHNIQPQHSQPQQQTQQKSRYQLSPENSDIFDTPPKQATANNSNAIPTTPPLSHSFTANSPQNRPLSPLTSSYAVNDTDSVYSESDNEQYDEEYQEQEEYEPTIDDHINLCLTGTELLMVMDKGMQKYHVSVNMPAMTKLVWSERGKIIGSQDLKDVTEVSSLPHAVHPQLDNLQWHTAVSGGPLSKWGESAWSNLGFTLTVKKSIKGASRRKKIDFVSSTQEIQQSWVIGLNAILQSKSQLQNGRKSTSLPFGITTGSGSNEVEKVVAYLDKVMGMDEAVVDKVAQLVEQKRKVIRSTSPPRTLSKRSSMTVVPVPPSYLTSPLSSPPLSASHSSSSFPAPPTPTSAIPAPSPLASLPAPLDHAPAPASVATSSLAPAQTEAHSPPTFTRSSTPTLPLTATARPTITRSNTSTGVLRVSPPAGSLKPRAPATRASSPLRRSLHL